MKIIIWWLWWSTNDFFSLAFVIHYSIPTYDKVSTESLIWILFSEMAAEHIQNMITKYNKREDLCLAQAIRESMEHNKRRQWTARANNVEKSQDISLKSKIQWLNLTQWLLLYYIMLLLWRHWESKRHESTTKSTEERTMHTQHTSHMASWH